MSLRLVPPPPDSAEMWKRLLNRLYLDEEDELFKWAKATREAIPGAEEARAAALLEEPGGGVGVWR